MKTMPVVKAGLAGHGAPAGRFPAGAPVALAGPGTAPGATINLASRYTCHLTTASSPGAMLGDTGLRVITGRAVASGQGGGVFKATTTQNGPNAGGSLTLTFSQVTRNRAAPGGGIFAVPGSPVTLTFAVAAATIPGNGFPPGSIAGGTNRESTPIRRFRRHLQSLRRTHAPFISSPRCGGRRAYAGAPGVGCRRGAERRGAERGTLVARVRPEPVRWLYERS